MYVGRVMLAVKDQDRAAEWYAEKLGFTKTVDVPFGEGDRWVEISPDEGIVNLALVPPHPGYGIGMTGIALDSKEDVAAVHAKWRADGVDCDDVMGGEGPVPQMFFFRDLDGNTLLLVAAQDR